MKNAVACLLVLSLAAPARRSCRARTRSDRSGPTADEIRREATRHNFDAGGHPLPLVANYMTGPSNEAFTTGWQLDQIQAGHFLLPWFAYPPPDTKIDTPQWKAYYEIPLARARALKLPIALVGPEWELAFTQEKQYTSLPTEGNPNVADLSGKRLTLVDPLGPPEVWREAGQHYMDSRPMRRLQEIYPDPPAVFITSSYGYFTEAWPQVEQSKRYIERYGWGRDDNFKRRVVADGWIALRHAMRSGMIEGLSSPDWKNKSRFLTYGSFGPPHFARPTDWSDFRPNGDWKDYSLYIPGRIDPSPLTVDGGSALYYAYDFSAITDYNVFSPQVEAMNWVFMLKEAYRLNPDFWFEVATWDGHNGSTDKWKVYAGKGQTFTPSRYGGDAQFALWLLRPRVLRQWPGWINNPKKSVAEPYFQPEVAAVDRVHTDSVLRRFWRQGELVANSAHPHPYQADVPPEYRNAPRWFLLDTSLDAPRPWTLQTEIPVYSIAYLVGRAPRRQWLIYAHAPLGDRKKVVLKLPGYGPVTVDVTVGGSFYLVDEARETVTDVAADPGR